LREGHESGDLIDRVLGLPWGSGSGMARVGARGYVFCAQIGDHPRPAFRYVEMADPLNPVIIDDTLTCLAQAQPPEGPDTERALDGDGHRLAFDAWTAARAHIAAEWNVAADPANLQPTVPKAIRDAAALVQTSRPPSMTLEEADTLVDVLEAPYPERTLRQVRRLLASTATASDKVAALAQQPSWDWNPARHWSRCPRSTKTMSTWCVGWRSCHLPDAVGSVGGDGVVDLAGVGVDAASQAADLAKAGALQLLQRLHRAHAGLAV
jgi:hypothetical protein